MANLAAANVTVVVLEVKLMGRKRFSRGTIAFGDGALLYPVGGIPLPAASSFGFIRNMDSFLLIGYPGGGVVQFNPWWDSTNNKLQLYAETTVATDQALIEVTNGLAPAAETYQYLAWGW